MKIWRMKKCVSVCCAVGVFFGWADCDLNSFLSQWTAGMWLYWQYVSETYSFFVKSCIFELMYDRAGRRFLAGPQLCVSLNFYVLFYKI